MSLWVQDPTCGFCMQNSVFWTRITSFYGSQRWPVILCMYNIVLSMRNTSLYGFQPSSAVYACKTAWLASELLVSMGPSPHVWFLEAKERLWTGITSLYVSQTLPVVLCMHYSIVSSRITSLYWSQPSSGDFAWKTATFGQTYKSLRVPDDTCRFVHAKQRD